MEIIIPQRVAILIDGKNISISVKKITGKHNAMLNIDGYIPKIVGRRTFVKLKFFKEGRFVSNKLEERINKLWYGSTVPCYKSADVPLTIEAIRIADKVDTIIILSGDSDYISLVKYLQEKGVRVEIAAVRESASKDLLEKADFHYIITEEDCYYVKEENENKSI